jgi:hypothetical protein
MIHRMLWKKVCYPALPCKLAAVVIHRMLWCKEGAIPAVMHAVAVVIHRMLWWKKGVLSLRAMQARCCHDLTECSGGRRCAILRCHARCCCDSQNALVEGVLSLLSCMQAAVMIHRMLWWKKVCYPCAAMQARCCCDSQNALVQGRVCYPCAAMQARCCCDPQNALVEEGGYPCAAMQARCCCDPQNAW